MYAIRSYYVKVSNSFQDFKEKAEKAFILKQLEANDWNISKTAELLDILKTFPEQPLTFT